MEAGKPRLWLKECCPRRTLKQRRRLLTLTLLRLCRHYVLLEKFGLDYDSVIWKDKAAQGLLRAREVIRSVRRPGRRGRKMEECCCGVVWYLWIDTKSRERQEHYLLISYLPCKFRHADSPS